MPYPKNKKQNTDSQSQSVWGTENKIYFFFVLLVPMFWEADKNKLFDFYFLLASNEKIIILY
jgi:hypothetical protein